MNNQRINIPEGMRDLLFDEAVLQSEISDQLEMIYGYDGYMKVETPALEYYDAFNFAGQPLPQESMYKLTDNSGRLLVIRPDCTTPIARIVSTKLREHPLPLKLSYTQKVYRISGGLSGKRGEILQSGIEFIGQAGIKSDIMCIVTAIKALESLGADFKIEIGHVDYYNSLIAELDLDEDKKEIVRNYVETKDSLSIGFIDDSPSVEKIRRIPLLFGGAEVLDEAAEIACGNAKALGAIEKVRVIYEQLSSMGYGDRVLIDLGTVQKLEYYTGTVFRGYMEGAGESVLNGGRYDRLLSNFGLDCPAVGFAVNVGTVAETLYRHGRRPETTASASTVIFSPCGDLAKAVEYRDALKKVGTESEISCFDTFEETVGYAKSKNMKKIAVIGSGDGETRIEDIR